jgi:hypothetical protein
MRKGKNENRKYLCFATLGGGAVGWCTFSTFAVHLKYAGRRIAMLLQIFLTGKLCFYCSIFEKYCNLETLA